MASCRSCFNSPALLPWCLTVSCCSGSLHCAGAASSSTRLHLSRADANGRELAFESYQPESWSSCCSLSDQSEEVVPRESCHESHDETNYLADLVWWNSLSCQFQWTTCRLCSPHSYSVSDCHLASTWSSWSRPSCWQCCCHITCDLISWASPWRETWLDSSCVW